MKNQKGSTYVIVFVIMSVVLALGGGLGARYIYEKSQDKTKSLNQQAVSVREEESQNLSKDALSNLDIEKEVEDLDRYVNEKYKFEFQYPLDWIIGYQDGNFIRFQKNLPDNKFARFEVYFPKPAIISNEYANSYLNINNVDKPIFKKDFNNCFAESIAGRGGSGAAEQRNLSREACVSKYIIIPLSEVQYQQSGVEIARAEKALRITYGIYIQVTNQDLQNKGLNEASSNDDQVNKAFNLYSSYNSLESEFNKIFSTLSIETPFSEPMDLPDISTELSVIDSKNLDEQRLKDIKFIQSKLEEYAKQFDTYPSSITQEDYIIAINAYWNDSEMQKLISYDEYNLKVDEAFRWSPEEILNNYLKLKGIISDPLPTDPELKIPYTYRFGKENNNSMVDTYLLAVKLSESINSILKNDVDGLILNVDCNDPVYCIKYTSETISKSGRDSERLKMLNSLKEAIKLYYTTTNNPVICENKNLIYSSASGNIAINGTGWLPIDFTKIPGGSVYQKLPIDPLNNASAGFVYTYRCDPEKITFELNSKWELFNNQEYAKSDGGNNADLYEIGTDLKLMP